MPLSNANCVELGLLKATFTNSSTSYYRYLLTKPLKYDPLFNLDVNESKKYPLSSGCAHLNISKEKARQGRLATEICLPFGNVSIVYKEPKRERAMPELTVRMMIIMTMHANACCARLQSRYELPCSAQHARLKCYGRFT